MSIKDIRSVDYNKENLHFFISGVFFSIKN